MKSDKSETLRKQAETALQEGEQRFRLWPMHLSQRETRPFSKANPGKLHMAHKG